MKKILLIGKPNSGKTNFFGQLFGRIVDNNSSLKISPNHQFPKDISLLQDVLSNLANGSIAGHTPTATWSSISLPVINEDNNEYTIDLPDYGGEQINQIFKNREFETHWLEKLNESSHWVVLIRLSSENTFLSERELINAPQERSSTEQISRWDANAFWIEIFQMFLHHAGIGFKDKITSLRLSVLLSCYDELEQKGKTPDEMLERKLPLFYKFLKNNWESKSISIWGLSSLGCNLENPEYSDSFIDLGPEKQGWIVPPGSTEHHSDLTLPINWLVNNNNY